jgi:WD40 repeat protein
MNKSAVICLLVLCLILPGCTPLKDTPTPAASPSPTRLLPTSTPASLPQPTHTATAIPFSPVISADNRSRLVEVGRIGKGVIQQLAWSPSGDTLAVATEIGVYIYSVEPLVELNYIDAPGGVSSLTYGADDQTLIVAFNIPDRDIHIYDPLSGELRDTFGAPYAWQIFYLRSTDMLLSVHEDQVIRLWSVSSGEFVRSITPDGYLSLVTSSPDGSQVITGSYHDNRGSDFALDFWDPVSGNLVGSVHERMNYFVEQMAISPDNSRLASMTAYEVVVRSLPAGDFSFQPQMDGMVDVIEFSADSQRLFIGIPEGMIQVRNAETGALVDTYHPHSDWIQDIAAQLDGWLVASAGDDGLVQVWDMRDGRIVGTIDGFHRYSDLQLSPDGTMIAALESGSLYVWDMGTLELMHRLTLPDRNIRAFAFSPDSQLLAAGACGEISEFYGCQYGLIHVWNVPSFSTASVFSGHSSGIIELAFTPDGRWLASVDESEYIYLWDIETRETSLIMWDGRGVWVRQITFSPDGEYMALMDFLEISLWALDTGEELWRYEWSANPNFVTFSPDSSLVVAGGFYGTITGFAVQDAARAFQITHPFMRTPSDRENTAALMGILFYPQSDRMIASYDTGYVAFFDFSSGVKVFDFRPAYSDTLIGLTPDGNYLLTNSEDGAIRIWGIAP